jgi:regulator of sigma E protease
MIEFLQSVLALIVTISILVTVHEFGHFYVAKKCGVHVERFSVGFGKVLVRLQGKPPKVDNACATQGAHTVSNEPLAGTEYCIAMIPLGGYVKMLDERDTFVADDLLDFAFNRKPLWQRTLIVAAGPLANFILAFFVYWILFVAGVSGVAPILGEPAPGSAAERAGLKAGIEILRVDDKATGTWSEVNLALFDRLGDSGAIKMIVRTEAGLDNVQTLSLPIARFLAGEDEPRPATALGLGLMQPLFAPILGEVSAGSPAETGGLKAGDQVILADGIALDAWSDFVALVQARAGQRISLRVKRGQSDLYLEVTPEAVATSEGTIGRIGVALGPQQWPSSMQRLTRAPFYTAWLPALDKTYEMTRFTFESIGKMIQGLVSTRNLSGPITIAKIANQTAGNGLESFLGFIALVSISLGVLNLLPIPMLDGGHLLYFLIEGVTGKPVSEQIQTWGLQIGMVFLVGIMMLAFYNDLLRL